MTCNAKFHAKALIDAFAADGIIYDILINKKWYYVTPLPIATNHGQNYPGVGELAHSYVLEC